MSENPSTGAERPERCQHGKPKNSVSVCWECMREKFGSVMAELNRKRTEGHDASPQTTPPIPAPKDCPLCEDAGGMCDIHKSLAEGYYASPVSPKLSQELSASVDDRIRHEELGTSPGESQGKTLMPATSSPVYHTLHVTTYPCGSQTVDPCQQARKTSEPSIRADVDLSSAQIHAAQQVEQAGSSSPVSPATHEKEVMPNDSIRGTSDVAGAAHPPKHAASAGPSGNGSAEEFWPEWLKSVGGMDALKADWPYLFAEAFSKGQGERIAELEKDYLALLVNYQSLKYAEKAESESRLSLARITELTQSLEGLSEENSASRRDLTDLENKLRLSRAEGASQWISTEERLPELGHIVLTYSTDKIIDTGWLCDADVWYLERTAPQDEPITYRVRDGQITHWHELPDPPKVAGEFPEGQ